MTDLVSPASFKPHTPGAKTARATGSLDRGRKCLTFKADDELFMQIKRFAMRTNKTISQSIRQILRARLSR